VADYDISCDSDEYVEFAAIASLCIVLFVVITPLSIVGFLSLNRLSQRMQVHARPPSLPPRRSPLVDDGSSGGL
jgi:hypothetical protein